MEEKNDEFFCGEATGEPIILWKKENEVFDYNDDYTFSASILRETSKLKSNK